MSGEQPQLVIHVGYPRAGSQYIQKRLLRPLSDTGLINFSMGSGFALRAKKDCVLDKTFWNSNGNPRVLSQEKFSCEMFGGTYAQHRLMVHELARQVPGAKILLVVRNQQEWCDSLYRYAVDKYEFRSPSAFFKRHQLIGETLRYDLTIESFGECFAEIKVLPFELLRNNQKEFNRQVFDYIGSDSFECETGAPGLGGIGYDWIPLFRLTNPFIRLVRVSRLLSDPHYLVSLRKQFLVKRNLWNRSRQKEKHQEEIYEATNQWLPLWKISNKRLTRLVDWSPEKLGYPVL